jgi:DNA-binding transcriptional MerR regulator
MARYSIKDLENLSGIKAHTIRIWEKRYKFIVPDRTDTNIRYYTDQDLKKLLNIAILNNFGYKISKVAFFNDALLHKRVMEVFDETNNPNVHVDNMVLAMIDLDEEKFEKLFSGLILRLGIEETISQVIYPFLEKTGVLWQTNVINPAQEHFVTNLIRQKIIVAIDSQINQSKKGGKHFTLFLPEGELHEIGLLFYAFLLKNQGHKVSYFGQSVPISSLKESEEMLASDYYLTSFTSSLNFSNVSEYLTELLVAFPTREFLVSGLQVKDVDLSAYPRVRKFSNLIEFKDLIAKL